MIQQEDILYGRISIAGEPIPVGGGEIYPGPYTVTPKTSSQVLATKTKTMSDDLTVNKISTYEVSNPNGITFIIGDI